MVDENRVEGAMDKLKGSVKEGIGKLTGDAKLKAEGAAEKAKGATRSETRDVKHSGEGAADKI